MPVISIVIPVYNAAPYLEQCLDSVLGQTFSNIEVLCINDASTDESLTILEAYAKKDSRVVVVNQEINQGSGPARNIGIEIARGDYLTFCDADDTYTHNALKTLYEAASFFGAPVSGGNIVFTDNSMLRIIGAGDAVACTQFRERGVISPSVFPPLWLPVYHPRYLIAADLLRKYDLRYPPLLRGQDPPFLAHVFCHADRIAVCPEAVYLCRGGRPGEKKLKSLKAVQDYAVHFAETFTIYVEHGAQNQALFFLAQALDAFLKPRNLFGLSREERKLFWSSLLPLVRAAGEELYQQDYAPYTIDVLSLKNYIALFERGFFFLLLEKSFRRVKKVADKFLR